MDVQTIVCAVVPGVRIEYGTWDWRRGRCVCLRSDCWAGDAEMVLLIVCASHRSFVYLYAITSGRFVRLRSACTSLYSVPYRIGATAHAACCCMLVTWSTRN